MKVRKKDIQAAKAPDAVLVNAATLFDWLFERRVAVLSAFGAVLVLVGVASWIRSSSTAKAEALGAKLAEAADFASRPVVEKPPENQEGDAKVDSFVSKDEKSKAINSALTELVEKDQGMAASTSAALGLAQVRYSEGKYDDAIALAQKYLDHPDGTGLSLFAYETIGVSYAAKKDFGKADETFKKIGNAGAPGLAAFHQGELQEMQGKKEDARKTYEKVAVDYEKDSVAAQARVRLDLLDMPADGQGALAAPAEAEEPAAPPPGKGKLNKTKPGVPAKAGLVKPVPKSPVH